MSNSSFSNFLSSCLVSTEGNIIFLTFSTINILVLLPLFLLILLLGLRRRTSANHADFFTYHMVVMETIYIAVPVVYCVGVYNGSRVVMMVASNLVYTSSFGQMSLHCLTCVERYLAAARPLAYLRLRRSTWLRSRSAAMLCVWTLTLAQLGFSVLPTMSVILLLHFLQLVFTLTVVSFCSISVLRALRRPAPGEGGGARDRADQSKQRAFNTIMAIMGALVLKLGSCLVCTCMYIVPEASDKTVCVILELNFWFGMPSSLVLPLLFLHRAGKLACCGSKAGSGRVLEKVVQK